MMTWIGKLWTGAVAYVSLLVGAGLSVAGNLADTYRTRGADVDGLDKVMAAGWPILVILAIEMFVSPRWSERGMFQVWRWIGCLTVGGMAMVVSWTHLHDLMASRGQLPAVTVLGPLAIDGMAIMATGLILSTRVRGHVRFEPVSADTASSLLGWADTDMPRPLKLDVSDVRMSEADMAAMATKLDGLPDASMTVTGHFDSGHDRWSDLTAPTADVDAAIRDVLGDFPPRPATDTANLNGLATWAQWTPNDDLMVADMATADALPKRTRTPGAPSYPQEFADMVGAWNPAALDRADMVKLSAAYFDVSARTARRWLAAVLNEPVSGPPQES